MWWDNKQAGETNTSSLISILLRFHVHPGIYSHLVISSIHPFIHSSIPPFIPSSLHPFIPSSLHPFIPSSLHFISYHLPTSLSSTFLLFYVEMAFPWFELTCVNRELFSLAKPKVLPTSPSHYTHCFSSILPFMSFLLSFLLSYHPPILLTFNLRLKRDISSPTIPQPSSPCTSPKEFRTEAYLKKENNI